MEPHVLRYWETEFPQLKPDKGRSGQRLYKKKDVDHVLHIKRLLYNEGYTISGARKKLNGKEKENVEEVLDEARRELKELLEMLK